MALVAYSDDSDLGSDSEEAEESPKVIVNGEGKEKGVGRSSNEVQAKIDSPSNEAKGSANDEAGGIDSIVDFDEDEVPGVRTGLLASIPSAKPIGGALQSDTPIDAEVDELTDVPTVSTWKVTQEIKPETSSTSSTSGFKKKKEKRKVQFIVPSLLEFAEEEEEEEEKELPERKKMKPSSTGTGLFAVLPEPKNLAVKETKRSLVPHILTKRPVPPVKKPVKVPVKAKQSLESNDSDEETGPTDFFSLSDSVHDPPIVGSVKSAPDVEPPAFKPLTPSQPLPEERMEEPTVSTHNYSDNIMFNRYEEESEFQPQYGQEISTSQPTGIDQEAFLRLTGKRRGKKEESINFIDVSADDALLTRDEWMTKALTEEKPSQSFSKKREGMPSQRTKQKHQITYLAHQAKERELELKNNWAQNRMTKMQTQAKYGF